MSSGRHSHGHRDSHSQNSRSAVSAPPLSARSRAMQSFVRVKYGDNKEALFNPWCTIICLLDSIRKICKCDKEIVIDLVDMQGHVTNLGAKLREYACDSLQTREIYVLIKIEKQAGNLPNKYTPLLQNLDKSNPELHYKLLHMSRPASKSKGKWGNLGKKGLKQIASKSSSHSGRDSPRTKTGNDDDRKTRSLLSRMGMLKAGGD
ncbi:uncharacterized protein C22orf15 [Lingula anatina]|uniref:Uncharacterized protein C22orf15 n=1 Tax=Lingula anatina TaxID=7574 RepID=A0A1S3GZL4_LINAN|nr:uncharacterized protein C22orf15 [Lingula anatina]XP_013379451.1 uncharacterized protein C22orf15 [Lingula anatina]|eukprot:XP_013379315.1 uncharacterized protein C22orf15 [Lingula anatina]